MNYYLLCEKNDGLAIDNVKFLIKCGDLKKRITNNFTVNDVSFVPYAEVFVTENPFNEELILFEYENKKFRFEIMNFHHENTHVTFYHKVEENA